MSGGSPIERLRRAGLHDALPDLLGIDEDVALREIGPFLGWVELARGERRHRQGDAADDPHIVASGRLRAVTEGAHGRPASVDPSLAPPLQRVGLLRREAFDKVVDIGYRYAVEALGPEVVARLCGRST